MQTAAQAELPLLGLFYLPVAEREPKLIEAVTEVLEVEHSTEPEEEMEPMVAEEDV